MFPNKYPGKCNSSSCGMQVAENQGFTQKINGRYIVWCAKCVPERIQTKRVLTADGKLITPYEAQNIDLIRSIPGARWDAANKNWTVSLLMSDRFRLLEVADRIGLDVDPSLRVNQSESIESLRLIGDQTKLYPYQIQGVNFLFNKKKSLLGDEMGLGKTLQSLMTIPVNGAALVICRAGLKYNWVDEVKLWRKDLTPIVLSGRGNFQWPNKGEVVIINNDILPKDFETPKKERAETMDSYWKRLEAYRESLNAFYPQSTKVNVIVDEAHDYKNKEAARSRKVKEICKMAEKVIGLTGSPLTNRPADLFGVLDVLGLAKEVFGNWNRFCTLFNAEYGRYGGYVWGKPQPIVPELLRRVMLRRRREEVLPNLPSKTYTNLLVGDVPSSLQKELDDMWDKWATAIEIEGSLPPFEEFSSIRESLARSRVDAMLEYVENAEEQQVPLVVFSAHLAPIDALLGRPGWAVINGVTSSEKRQEIVRAFQAGHLKGLGVTIKAGGVGINLTHAWKGLFVDLDWTPASNWQAEDRLARIGQKSNKVEIVRMVSNHPLDLHVQNLLVNKIDTIVKSVDNCIAGQVMPSSVNETEEQFQERMRIALEKTEKEIEERNKQNEENKKARAKSKVAGIHSREKARLKSNVVVPPLTSERIDAIRSAFRYMLSVCDGAIELDGMGFNKPDAVVAHCLLTAGLETEIELEAGQYILMRYHRQLSGNFPILFKKTRSVKI